MFNRAVDFQCSVACTASFNSDGFLVVTFSGTALTDTSTGNFAFLNSHTVVLTQDDRSFSRFDYWATVTPGTTSSPLGVAIDTFAEVTGDLTTSPSVLRGDATYQGLATGFYTMNAGSARGEFTADVELTADFDDNEIGSIVDNFDSITDMNHSLHSWELTLEDAEFNNRNFDATPSTFVGSTIATGGRVGQWQGIFGGKANPGDGRIDNDYPEGVAGEFVGHFSNGYAAGAFGAEYHD